MSLPFWIVVCYFAIIGARWEGIAMAGVAIGMMIYGELSRIALVCHREARK